MKIYENIIVDIKGKQTGGKFNNWGFPLNTLRMGRSGSLSGIF